MHLCTYAYAVCVLPIAILPLMPLMPVILYLLPCHWPICRTYYLSSIYSLYSVLATCVLHSRVCRLCRLWFTYVYVTINYNTIYVWAYRRSVACLFGFWLLSPTSVCRVQKVLRSTFSTLVDHSVDISVGTPLVLYRYRRIAYSRHIRYTATWLSRIWRFWYFGCVC